MWCLLFYKGAPDETDSSTVRKTASMSLPFEQELTFPDVDDVPLDETDFPDDLDEDDAVSHQDVFSVWEEINKLLPLGSPVEWISKPNTKVPTKKEPRFYKVLAQLDAKTLICESPNQTCPMCNSNIFFKYFTSLICYCEKFVFRLWSLDVSHGGDYINILCIFPVTMLD